MTNEISIENLFQKWEEYLTGAIDHKPGSRLKSYSIMNNIQSMVDDDFIFNTFNDARLEMSKNKERYENHFCSNEYLIRSLIKGYQETQLLYIRRLTEDSKRWQNTCSLVNLLTKIEENACHLTRKKFVNFYKNNLEFYINNIFDTLSEKDSKNRSDDDKVSKKYVGNLKNKLLKGEFEAIKEYIDKALVHSDFIKPRDNFVDGKSNINIETIHECHKKIIEVYREIESNFFLSDSSFGEVSLYKEIVLQKADKPFLT